MLMPCCGTGGWAGCGGRGGRGGGPPGYPLLHLHSLREGEPPVHTRLRRLVAAAFGRGQVERLRSRIAVVAAGLADDLLDAGSAGSPVDLLPRYAEPLP